MRPRRYLVVVATLTILALLAAPALARVGTSFAQLNGTVTAASGGTIAKASVTLRADSVG